MENISIFNYEAYYLDYLEGNLGEEDTALLLAFLGKHPELMLNDDAMYVLDKDISALDLQFKENLKEISFNETDPTHLNVEQFLIAESEDLLSHSKSEELNLFIKKNPSLLVSQKIYQAAHLIPDKTIVYENKSSLKQSRKIVYWPYVALAAASIAILLFFLNPSTNVVDKNGSNISRKEQFKDKNSPRNPNYTGNKKNLVQDKDKNENSVINNLENQPKYIEVADVTTPQVNREPINKMKVLPVKKLNSKEIDLEITENSYASNYSVTSKKGSENDYTLVGFNDMNNPIKPITSKLSTVVKQEVDFRTAKATEKHSGGFYLKIGKLEISRRKF